METEHVHPPEPGKPKNFTQVISLLVGAALFILGLCGLLFNAFAGLHLSELHSLIIAFSGIVLFYQGYWQDDTYAAFYCCLGFGLFFGLMSVIGFTFGQEGIPNVGFQRLDPYHLVIWKNHQELGKADHVLNAIISIILMGGALDWSRRHEQKQKRRMHRGRLQRQSSQRRTLAHR